MKKNSLWLALLLSCFQSAAFATDMDHGDHQPSTQHGYSNIQKINAELTIENATAKATIPGTKVSSGYMKIINKSDKAITLIGATSVIAKHTEFHRMFMRDSQMAMRKVDALEIPAKDSVTLTNNGYHLMFMGVKNALKADQVITVSMQQANGEQFDVQLLVMPLKKH